MNVVAGDLRDLAQIAGRDGQRPGPVGAEPYCLDRVQPEDSQPQGEGEEEECQEHKQEARWRAVRGSSPHRRATGAWAGPSPKAGSGMGEGAGLSGRADGRLLVRHIPTAAGIGPSPCPLDNQVDDSQAPHDCSVLLYNVQA